MLDKYVILELTFFPFRRKREARQFQVFEKTSGARGVAEIERERRRCPYFMDGSSSSLGHMDPRTPGLQAGWNWGRCH